MLLTLFTGVILGAGPSPDPALPAVLDPDQPPGLFSAAALANPTVASCHAEVAAAARAAPGALADRRAAALAACAPLLGDAGCVKGLRSLGAPPVLIDGLAACCRPGAPALDLFCAREALDDRRDLVAAVRFLAGDGLSGRKGLSEIAADRLAFALAILAVPPAIEIPDALRRPVPLCEVGFQKGRDDQAVWTLRDGHVELAQLSIPPTPLQGTQVALELIRTSAVMFTGSGEPRASEPCEVLVEGGKAASQRSLVSGLRSAGLTVYTDQARVPAARARAQPPRWTAQRPADPQDRISGDVKLLLADQAATWTAPAAELRALVQALEPATAEYQDLSRKDQEACRAATDAGDPLPARCAEQLARNRPALTRLRSAIQAPGRLSMSGLDVLAEDQSAFAETGWLRLQHGGRLAAWEVASLVRSGKSDEALAVCADALELGGDATMFTGLVGMAVGKAIQGMMLQPCARAIDQAGREQKARGCGEIAAVRRAMPRFSEVFRSERIAANLIAFGGLLDSSHQAALPAGARATVASHPISGAPAERELREYWPFSSALYDEMIDAADLSPQDRARFFDEAKARHARSKSAMAAIKVPDFARFGERHDRMVATLDLLLEACRMDLERKATWPQPVLPDRISAAPAADGRKVTLTATVPGDPLSVTMTAGAR